MKISAIVTLFAAALISAAGCHWRHRNWRDHRDYSDNSYRSDDHVGNQRVAVAERES
jgi:hypothetical protein